MPISHEPAPRPVPNSKRPSERWSIIAARSARRTGWLVTGFSGQMPEPTWMRSVCASANGMNDSLAERCEYSVRQWCSRDPRVLPVVRVGLADELDVVEQPPVLGDRVVGARPGRNVCRKIPNSTSDSPLLPGPGEPGGQGII